jgi:hypothetical protein
MAFCAAHREFGVSQAAESRKGANMPTLGTRILLIGKLSSGTQTMLSRLADRGWASQVVETLHEAAILMKTSSFDMILADESLPDGRAYAITAMVVRRGGTLLVSIALSDSCLWLPVVAFGSRVLGSRALNPEALEFEAQKILSARDGEDFRSLPATSHQLRHRTGVPRRKTPAAA